MNAQQTMATVADPAHPLLVLAGPGTGKTKTLIARIVHMLRDQSAPLALARAQGAAANTVNFGILALTFSKAAAVNMQTRLSKKQRLLCWRTYYLNL